MLRAMIEQSFMKALFHGVVAEDLVYPYPEAPEGERDEVRMMLDSIRKFHMTVDSAKIVKRVSGVVKLLPEHIL